MVTGDDKLLIVDQMRGVLKQQAAFFQRFPHQLDVALLQIPHTAVDEFGAS